MEIEEGEPSKKGDSDENDKPLKKARYAWEVKGKYHLKDKSQPANVATASCDDSSSKHNETSDGEAAQCSCSDNKEPPLGSLMSAADKIMDFEIPAEILRERGNDVAEDAPVEDAVLDEEAEDYYLLRWQARQLAKGFVDNTINRVLEQWRLSVHASDIFVENCDGDELVEDEGILMAIQSHGLRQELDQHSSYSDNDTESSVQFENALDNSVAIVGGVQNRLHASVTESGSDCRDNEKIIDDTDFLNTAVAVAISNKGLSSCSYK